MSAARVLPPWQLVQDGHLGCEPNVPGQVDVWMVYVEDAQGRFTFAGRFIGSEVDAVQQALQTTGATCAAAVRGRV